MLLPILLAVASVFLFYKKRDRLSLVVLCLAAMALRHHYITLDPFLNDWDEQFHALVAKNMMTQPFAPMLRVSTVMNYDYTAWCCNHIWLHKQPLFLWQMALSMKIFGINEVALRIPNMLMSSILIFFIYRIGSIWANKYVGFIAAFISVFARYQLELVSGNMPVDHNDIAFMYYTCGSIWAYSEYSISEKRKWQWAVLVGVCAGCAVLCKWLTGMFVFSGWGLALLTQKENRSLLQNWLHIITGFAVSCAVFMPWQIYTHFKFPKESTYERAYNSRHLVEALEGHDGNWKFYFTQSDSYYGLTGCILIVIGLGMLLFWREKISKYWLTWLLYIALPYLLFTVAATKMPSYVYFISPILHLTIALCIYNIYLKIQYNTIQYNIIRYFLPIGTGLLIAGTAYNLYIPRFAWFTRDNIIVKKETARKMHNTAIFKSLNHKIDKNTVILGCNSNEDIDMMFYTENNVYAWYPTAAEYAALKAKKCKIAAFQNHDAYVLPPYIAADSIYIIHEKLQ